MALVIAAAAAALVLTQPGSGRTVAVPAVVGTREQAALIALHGAGLEPVASQASSPTVPVGVVISQAPNGASRASRGARVQIVVSDGPASAPLPDVSGLSAAKAALALHNAHYRTRTKAQASKTVVAGVVIGTEPPAETEVQEGRVVTLLVSSGPAPVRVPDVTGESLEAAEANLTTAELTLGTVTRQVSSTQSPGTVISQSPAGGSSAQAGEKINLTVAKAPKEVAVPNVKGLPEQEALAKLEHAGFKPRTETRATPEQSNVGLVLEAVPAGGTKARKGSTVTVVVGALMPTTTGTTSTPTTTTTTTTTTSAATPPAASE